MYFVYTVTINIHMEDYGYCWFCLLYTYSTLRDENWFWFLPLTRQYGIAAGRGTQKNYYNVEYHLYYVTDLCKSEQSDRNINNNIIKTYF